MIAPHGADIDIPMVSNTFIDKFISSYNKGDSIKAVLVKGQNGGIEII